MKFKTGDLVVMRKFRIIADESVSTSCIPVEILVPGIIIDVTPAVLTQVAKAKVYNIPKCRVDSIYSTYVKLLQRQEKDNEV